MTGSTFDRGIYVFRLAALVGAALLAVTLITLSVVNTDIRPLNAGLVFLLLTLTVSATYGHWAGILAAVLSNLALTYFFLEPIHRLWVSDPQHIGALAIFLFVSAVGSSLLASLNSLAREAMRGRRQAEVLLGLNRAMIGQTDPQSALQGLCQELVGAFGVRGAAVLVKQSEGWAVVAASGMTEAGRVPDAAEAEQATAAADQRVGRQLEGDWGVGLVPLQVAGQSLGILRIDGLPAVGPLGEDEESLLTAFANEAALAVSRLQLAHTALNAEALRRVDEIKTAILSSIAHDLKTPLATIKTSISSLQDESVGWSETDRSSFLDSVQFETERLNKTISSLLDLNRIESGAVHAIMKPVRLDQLAEEAVEVTAGALSDRHVSIVVPAVEIRTDESLIRHALTNLLENAAAYSRPDGELRVLGRSSEEGAELIVEDEGPGIDPEDLPYVFSRFTRGRRTSSTRSGSGLGLAIVKGFVTLCGGEVQVESAADCTRFTIKLPPQGVMS